MKRTLVVFFIAFTAFFGQTGARYLIVTHDNYYSSILPLAEWKNRTGMKCRIAKLSEIGSTADAIRNYVVNAYNTWSPPPEYLLLVGAPNYIPMPMVNGTYSDNYYTNMDADIYNEILSGRLTVHDVNEAKTVVNKILLYQRYPYTADPTWFKKGTVIVNIDYDPPDDSIYWSDAKHAAGLMVANGYVRVDTFSDQYGHNSTHVISAVNAGRSYVMYRGSGVNNWGSPFDCNPGLTTNGAKLPIVLSTTCRQMGTGSTPAASEYWLLTGTPTLPRGAAGYFATTTAISGGAHLRSAVAKGFFDAAFGNHKRTLGEACEGGRLRVYSLYPGDAHEYYGFTTLGDPEMGLWTDTPCSLTVVHPSIIPIVSASFSVRVIPAAGGTAISGAFVCVMGKQDTSLYALDTTDASGDAYFTVHPQIFFDTVRVTVTGQNLRPYEGYMTVSSLIPYIQFSQCRIDDSLSGNDDGFINPGESINLPVWVENMGAQTGLDVHGTLRSADSFITVIDSVKSYRDIPGFDSAYSGDDGYRFTVRSDCPDNHPVDLSLTCRDSYDSTWSSSFSVKVFTAILSFQGAILSGGNGNSVMEPGETLMVNVNLRNSGSVGLSDCFASLTTTSPYVSVLDPSGTYPRIGPDSISGNDADLFVVYAPDYTPEGTIVPFRMILSAAYFQDTFDFNLVVGRRHYYVWNPDPTPTSGSEIHTLLTGLGYGGEIGATLPSNLDLYRSVFVCAGVYPNNRVIAVSSMEALALRDYLLAHGGRVYLEGGDVWFYDPRNNNGYCFDTLFGLRAIADGNPDMGPVAGQLGTFTAGMEIGYAGENGWMDHISAVNGFLVFRDADNEYDCGVAYDQGSYRTVGVSFELGGLIDGPAPSNRSVLLDSIMHFFGIPIIGIQESKVPADAVKPAFQAFPSVFRQNICFQIRTAESEAVYLKIYDLAGRLRRTIIGGKPAASGIRTDIWVGTDDHGRSLPEGVYFARLETGNYVKTIKIIYLR
jgi:hypothetical protein